VAGPPSGQARRVEGHHHGLNDRLLLREIAEIDRNSRGRVGLCDFTGPGGHARKEQAMAIWIDPPSWPAHGRLWSHLISDTSYGELQTFAEHAGIPARGFDGDHYDVPQESYAALVAAGARPVDGMHLARLLRDSGLRFQKRKGERPLAAYRNVLPQHEVEHTVHVVASSLPTPDESTAAAAVFVTDAGGALLLVRTVVRDAWGAPAGVREPGETVLECAGRETWEEAGLRIDLQALRPCGYERVTFDAGATGRWPHRRNYVACFATVLQEVSPPVAPGSPDVDAAEWVQWPEAQRRCSGEFWWPLFAHIHRPG
jgi:8-oxo-dGTP pyrophosphatase MutT (NUDIX family)